MMPGTPYQFVIEGPYFAPNETAYRGFLVDMKVSTTGVQVPETYPAFVMVAGFGPLRRAFHFTIDQVREFLQYAETHGATVPPPAHPDPVPANDAMTRLAEAERQIEAIRLNLPSLVASLFAVSTVVVDAALTEEKDLLALRNRLLPMAEQQISQMFDPNPLPNDGTIPE